jgi:hypothetical protein
MAPGDMWRCEPEDSANESVIGGDGGDCWATSIGTGLIFQSSVSAMMACCQADKLLRLPLVGHFKECKPPNSTQPPCRVDTKRILSLSANSYLSSPSSSQSESLIKTRMPGRLHPRHQQLDSIAANISHLHVAVQNKQLLP